MNRNLLILGLGQYGKVAEEIAASMNFFEKIDFLDDKEKGAIGSIDDYPKFRDEYKYAFVAIGVGKLRASLSEKLKSAGYDIATLVSPMAYVSPSATVSEGCAVEPMAVIHTGCILHEGCFVSAGAVVNHFAICEKCVHVDCNATVAGAETVPQFAVVAAGTVYKDR